MKTKSNIYKQRHKQKPVRGWPPERRAKQAAMIRARKPWLKSTGPKTAAGKRACRYNGLKHGRTIAAYRETRAMLHQLRTMRRVLVASINAHLSTVTPHSPRARRLTDIQKI